MSKEPGHWKVDKPNEYLFAIKTNDNRVSGPYDAKIGVSTYADMKDRRWDVGHSSGCGVSRNPEKTDEVFCIQDRIRFRFKLPSGPKPEMSHQPGPVYDQAVLTEILFWARD